MHHFVVDPISLDDAQRNESNSIMIPHTTSHDIEDAINCLGELISTAQKRVFDGIEISE